VIQYNFDFIQKTKKMKPTEDLMHEQQAIVVMLNIMSKISGKIRDNEEPMIDEIGSIIDFLKTFADKCLHGKEEEVLFPALVAASISFRVALACCPFRITVALAFSFIFAMATGLRYR